jgi:hypothetical protein
MIEVYGNTEFPWSVAEGRYILFRDGSPLLQFVDPAIALGMRGSDMSAVKFRALSPEETGADVPSYYGEVFPAEYLTQLGRISAVCDTIAEVNALVASSATARAIFRNALDGIQTIARELHGQSLEDENAEEIEEIRAFTLLNNSGDSTITWEKQNDDVMRTLIEKKMGEGMAFFVIHPKALGFIPRPKSRISDVDDIMKRRSISVKDDDFAEIIASGLAGIAKRPEIDTERAQQCYDAATIARSQSIGVMPMRGG